MSDIPLALSAADRESLRGVFGSDTGLPLPALQGFLFAVCAAAHPVDPSEWLGLVFREAGVELRDRADAERIIPLLLALYNEIDQAVWSDRPSLPDDCRPLQPPVANFADKAPLHLWARGFELAHNWLDVSSEVELPENLAIGLATDVLTLTFFASREQAEEELAQEDDAPSLEQLAAEVVADLPEALADYRDIGETIASLSG